MSRIGSGAHLVALALVSMMLAAPQVAAQAVVSTGQSFIDGRIIPGARQDDGTRLAGLRLTLAEGWKTYWRSPGEAGIPPSFDWSGSENIDAIEVLWPRPELFMSFGLQSIGYRDRVVLPLLVTPTDPAQPMTVALSADLGVCKDICVLERFEIAETIAADLRPIGAAQIARATAAVPPPGRDVGLSAALCRVIGAGRDRRFELELNFGRTLKLPVVLVEGTEQMWLSKVTSEQTDDRSLRVSARLSLASETTWIDRGAFRATVLAENLAADVQGCTAPAG